MKTSAIYLAAFILTKASAAPAHFNETGELTSVNATQPGAENQSPPELTSVDNGDDYDVDSDIEWAEFYDEENGVLYRTNSQGELFAYNGPVEYYEEENEESSQNTKREANWRPANSWHNQMGSWMQYRDNAWKRDAEDADVENAKREANWRPDNSWHNQMGSWMQYRDNAWKRDAEDADVENVKREANWRPANSWHNQMGSWMQYRDNAWKRDAEDADVENAKREANWRPDNSWHNQMGSWMQYRDNAW